MIFPRTTPMQNIEIWAPKYSNRTVLLAAYKVGAHNKITFTRAKSMGTDPYYVSGKTVQSFPVVTNGSVKCYAVDLDKLERLEYA